MIEASFVFDTALRKQGERGGVHSLVQRTALED
jgi:hypothetical protein